MKYVGKDQPIETRKKIQEQQKAFGQAKHRSNSYDRADAVVKKYYSTHVNKLVIKGS